MVYLALTTKYFNMIDEEQRTVQFEVTRLIKITIPRPNEVCFEYHSANGIQSITFGVATGKFTAAQIVEEVHFQISLLLSKS